MPFAPQPGPVLGVVSHALPPGPSGYHFMLEALLGGIPEESVALVGLALGASWGARARIRLPIVRPPRTFVGSVAAALATTTSELVAPSVLPRAFPNVRRIFATLDPTIGVALAWARAARAELWMYGIDLHASSFWSARGVLRGTLERWRDEALAEATRTFALSGRMADWMRARGARGPVEVLPPLADVGAAVPVPVGPPTFLYSGWIYTANAEPLCWLERAVTDLAPGAVLRMVTPSPPEVLRSLGLDPTRWNVAHAKNAEEVARAVAEATWGVLALDPNYPNREALRVAWPTKVREYLAVGRPVLCIAGEDYAAAEIAREGGWGVVASSEEGTRRAVSAMLNESRAALERRGRLAHAFALDRFDDKTVGARFRARALDRPVPSRDVLDGAGAAVG